MIQWGWIDNIADLSKKILSLEAELRKKKLGDVHEIETVPCIAQDNSSTDMRQTHVAADVGEIFVVPFKFSGEIALRRLSLVCAATSGNSANIGLCLYALNDLSRVDSLNAKTGKKPELKKMLSEQWIGVTGTTQVRLDLEYTRELFLSSANAIYFAAWTIDDDEGRVFCPNPAVGSIDASKSFRAAFQTNGTAGVSSAFPDTLSITGNANTPAAPCVVGRSRVGIRVFGSFTDD